MNTSQQKSKKRAWWQHMIGVLLTFALIALSNLLWNWNISEVTVRHPNHPTLKDIDTFRPLTAFTLPFHSVILILSCLFIHAVSADYFQLCCSWVLQSVLLVEEVPESNSTLQPSRALPQVSQVDTHFALLFPHISSQMFSQPSVFGPKSDDPIDSAFPQ